MYGDIYCTEYIALSTYIYLLDVLYQLDILAVLEVLDLLEASAVSLQRGLKLDREAQD